MIQLFKVLKLDHIAIAVPNLEESRKLYTEILGMELRVEERSFPSQKVKICLITGGETDLELVESLVSDGPTAKMIEKKGGGLHHIGLIIDNAQNAVDTLNANGIRMVKQDYPHLVAEDQQKIVFIHPQDAGGVLIELLERPEKE